MRREVNMKKLYGVVIAIAVILFFGTFGAIEVDSITLGQGMVQIMASVIAGVIGGLMYRTEVRRDDGWRTEEDFRPMQGH